MKYEISGENFPVVTIHLDTGESVYTQTGGMSWMTSGIAMKTNIKGGLIKAMERKLTGESFFMTTYTAKHDKQFIAFASSFPGNIVPLDLNSGSYICQKHAFLCAQPGVKLSALVPNKLKAVIFGGEGIFMQKLSGHGYAFLEIDGSVKKINLAAGEKLIVNVGNVAAYESGVRFSAQMIKGVRNILFGGEGLFVPTLEGPGKVYLQTMTLPTFVKRIVPFLPKPEPDKSQAGHQKHN